ncbi:hypothetical protein PV328_010060 [Microctonus aethiopoides]|uniref:Amine oxidase domain-containing protein n=1 Tax=Microctonus aethiopoides TaxID=144406 RepID=A0AA39C7A6_9HYME|nr:hypothetical protein PV328_010060 [Microctonus aethiopoides]
MSRKPTILIIGAGAAGIAAACRLIENGLENVLILEAKNRIGGRIYTTEFADNVIELGAQWVHGEKSNVVYDLANKRGSLATSSYLNNFEKHKFINSQGEIVPLEQTIQVWKLYYMISEKASRDLANTKGSYGEYFIEQYYSAFSKNRFTNDARAAEFLEWMEKFDNSIQCSDSWLDVSAQGITEYWTCEGDLLLNWKDQGYKTLFDLLTRRHLDTSKGNPLKDKIKFLSEVTNIDYTNNDEIIVRTIDGEKYSATNVIFTCSLGVLKSQHTTLFVPSLPKKNELSIKGLGFGSVNKIFLKFPHRWWPEDSAGFGLIWRKEDKEEFIKSNLKENHWVTDVFQFFTVDYQPRVLCGWITGESSRYIETLSDTQIKDGLCDLLDRFLGKNFNIPQPDKILRSIWYTDKHFRGCYSYRSVDTERLNVSARDLASPILGKCGKPIILFAGEATHDHYYSTVHGAVETGYREADRLINYYRILKSHL